MKKATKLHIKHLSNTTHQSPILYLRDGTYYPSNQIIPWVCCDGLRKVFELPAKLPGKIQFYSQSEPDGRYTTLFKVPRTRRHYDIVQPLRTTLYVSFRWWVGNQICAGRPYIGVVYWG